MPGELEEFRGRSVVLTFFSPTCGFCQQMAPQLASLPADGGKGYPQVRCGLQDRAGDLWFGTTGEGVFRYDGKGFTQYTVGDGLNSNTVCRLVSLA